MSRHRLGLIALLAVTAVWGSTFPGMKPLTTQMSALEIIGLRCLISGIVFVPVLFAVGRAELRWGFVIGAVQFVAFYLQVLGLAETTSNRNAFVTGLNVLIVPFLARLWGQRLGWSIWLGAACAMAGLAGLFYEDAPWATGDTLTLIGSFFYATFVLLFDFSAKAAVKPRAAGLAAVESLTMLMLALVVYVVTEPSAMASLWQRAEPHISMLLYLGIVASGVIVWLQAWGQQGVRAVEAALIYGLEPVFAASLAAWWIDESFGLRAGIGASLIVLGVMLSQLEDSGVAAWDVRGKFRGFFGRVSR
jgi:drug/metabolite transporter (DMT)-like permease